MSSEKVIVESSTIPNGGFGLFALTDIKQGEEIIEYSGEVLTFNESRQKRNRSYLKVVSLNKHIDAADPTKSSIARYINDHVDPNKRNCNFKTVQNNKVETRIIVFATRDILKGEELFVDYGRGHWLFCEEYDISSKFLNLEIIPGGGVIAQCDFEKSEQLTVYLSPFWTNRFGPGFGASLKGTSSVHEMVANCRYHKNPFLIGTIQVQAIREIKKGEHLIVDDSKEINNRKTCFFVTGFGKFHGVAENPTTLLMKNLRPHCGSLGILGLQVWETSMNGVEKGLQLSKQIIKSFEGISKYPLLPNSVSYVHFGVYAGSSCFYLESKARNLTNFFIPDEEGAQPINTCISTSDGGKNCYRTCAFNLEWIRDRLKVLGHNVEISDDAGDFICNYTYYRSLSKITCGEWGHDDSLFVHVPSLNVADESEQLRFAKDLLHILAFEVRTIRNPKNLFVD